MDFIFFEGGELKKCALLFGTWKLFVWSEMKRAIDETLGSISLQDLMERQNKIEQPS